MILWVTQHLWGWMLCLKLKTVQICTCSFTYFLICDSISPPHSTEKCHLGVSLQLVKVSFKEKIMSVTFAFSKLGSSVLIIKTHSLRQQDASPQIQCHLHLHCIYILYALFSSSAVWHMGVCVCCPHSVRLIFSTQSYYVGRKLK